MTVTRHNRMFVGARVFSLIIALLLVACGVGAAPTGQAPDTDTQPTSGPTQIPRTGDQDDVILVTTTSTQDSGLLDQLLPAFEQQSGYRVKTVAVGSGAAIALGQRGEADVVLAHAPESEREFVASGAGLNRSLVMYNDFILVGPAADPAEIAGTQDALAALRAIAAREATFISRGDNSGTHQLEQRLWSDAGVSTQDQPWYVESGTGMGQTLQIADQRSAYTLADRGTFLAFNDRLALRVLAQGDTRLLNVYHIIAVNPDRFAQVNHAGAQAVIAFLLAPETQQQIDAFGRDRFGEPLFTPCAQNSCGLENPDG